jgi:uncharacterized phage protein (TIGR01671 family)
MNNRIIKFRAWDKEKRVMLCKEIGITIWSDGSGSIERMGESAFEGEDFIAPSIEKFVLMQFTGLLDKNGKEIYEGDIVECEQMQGLGKIKGIVHFGIEERGYDGNLLYDARIYLDTRKLDEGAFKKRGWGGEFVCFHYNPVILGNIYENPTLLTPTTQEGGSK